MNYHFWGTRKIFTPNEDKNKEKRGMLNVCWPFSKLDKNSLVHESSKIEIIKLLRDIISITDHKSQSEETVENSALPPPYVSDQPCMNVNETNEKQVFFEQMVGIHVRI